MPLYTQRGGVVVNRQGPVLTATSVSFPLRTAGNSRYLVDANGVPVPILGRNAWSIIGIPAANRAAFFADTVAKGFNAIEVWIPGRFPTSVNIPRDGDNNLPFVNTLGGSTWNGSLTYANNNAKPDFSTASSATAYWDFADALLTEAATYGLAVVVFFAYVGFEGTTEGWMDEMEANGATKMRTYADFVVTRLGSHGNLIWAIGGDRGTGDDPFTAPQAAVEEAFIAGVTSGNRSCTLVTTEWKRNSIGTDLYPSSVTLNNTYASATEINNQGDRAYDYAPTLPAFCIEYPFEDEAESVPFRRYAWWAMLSTCGGYMFGNHNVYKFLSPTWEAHLNSAGAVQGAVLNQFISQIDWWTLVPTPSLVTSGQGTLTGDDWVASTVNPTGTLMVAYIPPAHVGSVTFDRSFMSSTFRARWMDPTTGRFTVISASVSNSGTQAFTPPTNSGGQTDAVLVWDRP